MENKRKGRNWRAKYLTKDEFNEWRTNHFAHLVTDIKWIKLILLIVLAAVIGSADMVASAVIQWFAG